MNHPNNSNTTSMFVASMWKPATVFVDICTASEYNIIKVGVCHAI